MSNKTELIQWQPEWLDEMYNNLARVKDSARQLKNWQQRSQELREQFMQEQRAYLDIPYHDGRESQKLDIFLPKGHSASASYPVLVYIHGGYWYALDKSDHSFVVEQFCEQDVCVVVLNYSLCPSTTIPKITAEVSQALAWVQHNIANFGGDPQKVTLTGHSAGGHLTAMMLLQNWQKRGLAAHQAPFRAAVAISGLFDLLPIKETPFLSMLQLTLDDATSQSPILHKPLVTSELYAVVGGNESPEFLRQNQLIQLAWGTDKVSLCEAIGSFDHLTIINSLTDPHSRLTRLLLDTLRR